jgi:hypothetical protein
VDLSPDRAYHAGVFTERIECQATRREENMAIPGHIDYQRREFCKDVRCPIQRQLDKCAAGSPEAEEVRAICKADCIHTTYEFHHWLIQHGYEVVRPAE